MIELNDEARFPLYGLPPIAREAIAEVSRSRQAPVDFAAAAALVAIGAAAGASAKVRGDYDNTLNLYAGVVGDSASNKSTPANDILAPIRAIHGRRVADYMAEVEARSLGAMAQGKKGAAQPTRLPPPRQLILTDATPEARLDALKANPEGLLWHRDELKGLFDDFGRYAKSGEASDLLTIFDGGDITINRKGEGLKRVEAPCLSIFGTIQPRALRDTFAKTPYLDSGLVPRFVWFAPIGKVKRDFSKSQRPDPRAMARWNCLIEAIEAHKCAEPITFGEGVREILDEFRNDTGNGREGYDATIWGKLHIIVYKLAAIAALARAAEGGFKEQATVEKGDMAWAIHCAHYFHRTAKFVEGCCRPQPDESAPLWAPGMGEMGKGDLIKAVLAQYPECAPAQLAEALGVSRQFINKQKKRQ